MTPLVVSYGGGVNSLAMLIGYIERGVRPDAVVFADTRGEKPETYDYLRRVLPPWLEAQGLPALDVVCRADFAGERRLRTGDQSLEAECLRLGFLPSKVYGYSTCADKWKLDPFNWHTRKRWQDALITKAIGFESGEEDRISAVQDEGYQKVYPLIEWGWTRAMCEVRIIAAGLPVPVKSACYYCPSSTKTEVLALSRRHPLLFRRAVDLEAQALGNGKTLVVAGLGRKWSWKDLIDADAAQFDLFPETPVEGCTQCQIAS